MGKKIRAFTTAVLSLFFFSNLFGQTADVSLKISHLTGDFYIFTTYNMYNHVRIPANGMYIVTNSGVIMIDTPWDSTQFQPLIDSIQMRHHQHVVLCVATHFHEDRTGGLEYYRKQGIKTYTTRQTDDLSKTRGMKRAEFLMDKDTVFTLGQYSFQTYYPGPGHTADNIVIWFDKEKVLYGGCLIKSTVDDDLGNLRDANVKEYAVTIEHVQKRFLHPKYVIPGHQDWTDIGSAAHTLIMAKKAASSP